MANTMTFPTFAQVKVSLAAAVVQNGTFTVAYPTEPDGEPTDAGDFVGSGLGHQAYFEGLQAFFTSPAGFTVSFGASITVTWLGATSIPANTIVNFQFERIGRDRNDPYGFQAPDSATASLMYFDLGSPATASSTAILATTGLLVTTLVALATPFSMDTPRNVVYVSSTTDTTQTITVRGFDVYGVPMSESVLLTGATPVLGKKSFSKVVSYQASLALAGNLSLGTGVIFGIPFYLPRRRMVIQESVDDAVVTTGTFVVADAGPPTGTTGDVRGTYAPATAPNGTHVYEVMAAAPERLGQLPQYGL
jgi:hypothetical protein